MVTLKKYRLVYRDRGQKFADRYDFIFNVGKQEIILRVARYRDGIEEISIENDHVGVVSIAKGEGLLYRALTLIREMQIVKDERCFHIEYQNNGGVYGVVELPACWVAHEFIKYDGKCNTSHDPYWVLAPVDNLGQVDDLSSNPHYLVL